jgi:hypothetical protein
VGASQRDVAELEGCSEPTSPVEAGERKALFHRGVYSTCQNWAVTLAPAARAAQLMKRIQDGPIRTGGWHWLDYNFNPDTPGFVLVGVPTAIALAVVDKRMPGYADEQIARLERLGGRERNMGDYRQILSWYAELLVMQQLALHDWPSTATFDMEPVAGASNYNPEVVVRVDGVGSLGL